MNDELNKIVNVVNMVHRAANDVRHRGIEVLSSHIGRKVLKADRTGMKWIRDILDEIEPENPVRCFPSFCGYSIYFDISYGMSGDDYRIRHAVSAYIGNVRDGVLVSVYPDEKHFRDDFEVSAIQATLAEIKRVEAELETLSKSIYPIKPNGRLS